MSRKKSVLSAARDAARIAEKAALERAVAELDGSIARISKALGMSRYQVYRRLDKYGLRGAK